MSIRIGLNQKCLQRLPNTSNSDGMDFVSEIFNCHVNDIITKIALQSDPSTLALHAYHLPYFCCKLIILQVFSILFENQIHQLSSRMTSHIFMLISSYPYYQNLDIFTANDVWISALNGHSSVICFFSSIKFSSQSFLCQPN